MNIKQMRLNLIFTTLSFALSLMINFYTTPILSKKLGDAAFGFVSIANDLVSYAAIVAAVLNSVSARFITVARVQKKYDKVNQYYTSVFYVNLILALFLLVMGVAFILYSDKIFNIPANLVLDVKITFALTFFNYIIVLVTSIFSVCTYITNRLDMAGVRNCISYAIKFILILIFFSYTKIEMYYVAITAIASSIFLAITNIKLTKQLLPEVKVKIKYFDKMCIKILALSGIWMAVSSLSQVLMTGLDSVITNKMIGADETGLLSIARTIPNAITMAISTIGVIFTPNFVELYAKNENEKLVQACKKSIEVMGMLLGVPIVGVMVFGVHFYQLWLPYKSLEEINLIQILSVLMMIQAVFNTLTISIAQLNVVTNKLKTPVFASLILGIVNVIVVVILVKVTNWGLYAVAGISSILFTVRYLLFNPLYASYVLKERWYIFYSTILKLSLPLLMLYMLYYRFSEHFIATNWKQFLLMIFSLGILGYIFIWVSVRGISQITLVLKRRIFDNVRKN